MSATGAPIARRSGTTPAHPPAATSSASSAGPPARVFTDASASGTAITTVAASSLRVCGRSVAEAFQGMYLLDAACRIQLLAQAGGALLEVPQTVIDGMPQQSREVTHGQGANLLWPALLRRLDRRLPGYDA